MPVSEKGARSRLFLLALAALAWQPAHAAACEPLPVLHAAHVRYVIDGDTVILSDGEHLRIVGLNAPEIGHDGAADQPYADAARQRLEDLVGATHGEVKWAPAADRRDDYGRTLGYLYVGGRDAAAVLLRAGLAALIAIPPNLARVGCYAAAERAARKAHRGLWSKDSLLLHDAETPAAHADGFQILRGRIESVRRLHAGVRLRLAGGITLWIPAIDEHYFHHDFRDFAGSRVLVRGWLHRYRGNPEIELHYPAVLTRLDGKLSAGG